MSACEALHDALRRKAGVEFESSVVARPWHSVGVAGEWCGITARFTDRHAAARMLHDLRDHPFDLPVHYVADIAAHGRSGFEGEIDVTVEALLVIAD